MRTEDLGTVNVISERSVKVQHLDLVLQVHGADAAKAEAAVTAWAKKSVE